MSIVYAHISFPTPKLDQAVQYCLLFYWVHDLFLDKLVEITESSVLSTWSASRFRPMLQKENKVSGLLRGEDGDFLNLGADSLAFTAALPSGGNPVGFFHTGLFLSILLFHEFLALWMKGLISSSEWKFCLLLFGHCVQSHWQWFLHHLGFLFFLSVTHLRMCPLSSLVSWSTVFCGNTAWCCSIIIPHRISAVQYHQQFSITACAYRVSMRVSR